MIVNLLIIESNNCKNIIFLDIVKKNLKLNTANFILIIYKNVLIKVFVLLFITNLNLEFNFCIKKNLILIFLFTNSKLYYVHTQTNIIDNIVYMLITHKTFVEFCMKIIIWNMNLKNAKIGINIKMFSIIKREDVIN